MQTFVANWNIAPDNTVFWQMLIQKFCYTTLTYRIHPLYSFI